jgi:hypothetical protein
VIQEGWKWMDVGRDRILKNVFFTAATVYWFTGHMMKAFYWWFPSPPYIQTHQTTISLLSARCSPLSAGESLFPVLQVGGVQNNLQTQQVITLILTYCF